MKKKNNKNKYLLSESHHYIDNDNDSHPYHMIPSITANDHPI